MPSHQVHEHLDELLLGQRYAWVHKWMDAPWKYYGRDHRRVRHDFPETPLTIYSVSGGNDKAMVAAALHIMLDEGKFSPPLIELLYRVCDKGGIAETILLMDYLRRSERRTQQRPYKGLNMPAIAVKVAGAVSKGPKVHGGKTVAERAAERHEAARSSIAALRALIAAKGAPKIAA